MKPDNPSDPDIQITESAFGEIAFSDEGGGTPLLMVPGLPGSTRDFRWIAPELAVDFRCIRMTFPGFAKTKRNGREGHSIVDRSRTALALLDELAIDKCVVLTHSAGAQIGAWLAAETDRVTHCAFIAPPGPIPHFPIRAYRTVSLGFKNSMTRTLLNRAQRPVYKAFGFPSYLTDTERMFSTCDAASMDFDLYTRLVKRMEQPTLLAWSNDDAVVPNDRFRSLAKIVPKGPRLEFEDAGHNPQKNYAVEIAAAIAGFARG